MTTSLKINVCVLQKKEIEGGLKQVKGDKRVDNPFKLVLNAFKLLAYNKIYPS